jgi:general secretion pathway protein L
MAAIPDSGLRPLPPWRAKLERFWRWWSGELLAMAPALAGAARAPLVALEGTTLVLLDPHPQGETRVDLADMDPTRAAAAVRSLLERAGETRGRARVALAPREALVRRVKMPAATEENLGSVLGFEMDRLTPFRADEVYHDHRVLARDSASGTIDVLLAVARREIVDARLAQMRELGVSVQGVSVREEAPRAGPALDVLPTAQRGERERPQERRLKQALAAGALVLLVAALAIPVVRKNREVVAIAPALDKAATEARATDAVIQDLDRQVADYNFLLAKKHAAAPVLGYIEEIARLLPDNTWLQQLDIKTTGKARELLITGETVSASKLIEILEQSQLLQNAAPRGPVTRGTQPGTERFVIAAEMRPRPQPEARPVTEAQAPASVPLPLAPAQGPPVSAPPTATLTPVPSSAPPPQQDLIFKPRGKTAPPGSQPGT